MPELKVHSPFQPMGDQPTAIEGIVASINADNRYTTLLGATGTGKTYSIAKVIERTQKPTLILAHNKTLAAQLYAEFKEFFQRTRSSTSSATTTIISRKRMCLGTICISRRTAPSTMRSTDCAWPQRVH